MYSPTCRVLFICYLAFPIISTVGQDGKEKQVVGITTKPMIVESLSDKAKIEKTALNRNISYINKGAIQQQPSTVQSRFIGQHSNSNLQSRGASCLQSNPPASYLQSSRKASCINSGHVNNADRLKRDNYEGARNSGHYAYNSPGHSANYYKRTPRCSTCNCNCQSCAANIQGYDPRSCAYCNHPNMNASPTHNTQNYAYGNTASPTNYAYGNTANPTNYAYNSKANPTNYAYSNNANPTQNYAYSKNANPTNYAYSNTATPANYAYRNTANPTNYAYSNRAKPTNYVYNQNSKTNYTPEGNFYSNHDSNVSTSPKYVPEGYAYGNHVSKTASVANAGNAYAIPKTNITPQKLPVNTGYGMATKTSASRNVLYDSMEGEKNATPINYETSVPSSYRYSAQNYESSHGNRSGLFKVPRVAGQYSTPNSQMSSVVDESDCEDCDEYYPNQMENYHDDEENTSDVYGRTSLSYQDSCCNWRDPCKRYPTQETHDYSSRYPTDYPSKIQDEDDTVVYRRPSSLYQESSYNWRDPGKRYPVQDTYDYSSTYPTDYPNRTQGESTLQEHQTSKTEPKYNRGYVVGASQTRVIGNSDDQNSKKNETREKVRKDKRKDTKEGDVLGEFKGRILFAKNGMTLSVDHLSLPFFDDN